MSGEVLSNEEMRLADAIAVEAGTLPFILMKNAGRAVADIIASRFSACRVAVLCGPGNNGGDGFVVARLLSAYGFDVFVACEDEQKGDAIAAAAQWHGTRVPLTPSALDGAGLVVDALFGAGLSRPPMDNYRALIEALNRAAVPVVAIDIPSGVDGDNGQVRGIAVEADITVTFFRLKPAHLLMPGRDLCGETLLADIGIPESACAGIRLFENSPALWAAQYRWPQANAHKYARGHCVVVSGPAHATG
ncbi:MAG: NAD(P)H-hydrate epimerase, partial [Rhizomicrobium sp.]